MVAIFPSSSSSSSSGSSLVPPLSPYGTLTGDLFLYAGGRAAFESPPAATAKVATLATTTASGSKSNYNYYKCILLGGLSDGLLPVPYTEQLHQCCIDHGFSLVQPLLSSSYTGFGHGSLDRDVEELCQLLDYLQAHRTGTTTTTDITEDESNKNNSHLDNCQFCLVGHSTGCQDIVHFLKVAPMKYQTMIRGVVLQAPVSDREYAQRTDNDNKDVYERNLKLAQEMRQTNQLEECMPRCAFWAPITARRFLDLHEQGGADDYFSSDYSDQELADRLGHVAGVKGQQERGRRQCRRHVLVAFSGADEYVPAHIDTQLLTNRLVQAMQSSNTDDKNEKDTSSSCVAGLCIPGANHNLSQPPDGGTILINEIAALFERIKADDDDK